MVAAATASKAFNVLVDFKFELGAALLGTSALTSKVEALESATNRAIDSVANLGLSFASQLGIAPTGLLGLIGQSIGASEELRKAQLGFSSVISANRDVLTGTIDTFNDRLNVSRTIVRDIAKDARKFGLGEGEAVNLTKLLSAALVPKGLAGTNFVNARVLARNILKASPILGLDPGLIEGQLLRALEGGASRGDTLFRRLQADTTAFAPFQGTKGTQAFNALTAAKRLEVLTNALGQFTQDTQILEDRLNSTGVQLQIMRNQLFGLDGLFQPFGQRMRMFVVNILKGVNRIIENEGARIIGAFDKVFSMIDLNPSRLAENILFLRSFRTSLEQTRTTLTRIGIFSGLAFILSKIFKVSTRIVPIVGILTGGFSILGAVFEGLNNPVADAIANFSKLASIFGGIAAFTGIVLARMGLLSTVLRGMAIVFRAIALPALLLFGVFSVIQRAIAIARVQDAQKLPALMADLAELGAAAIDAINKITLPFRIGFDALASLIAPLFGIDATVRPAVNLILALVNGLARLGESILAITALFAGLGALLGHLSYNIGSLLNRASNPFEFFAGLPSLTIGASDAFNQGFEDFLDDAMRRPPTLENGLVSQTVNINKVEIQNQFKEQAEPDRVAFTIKDQILKAAANPLSATNANFQVQGAF